MNKLPLIALAVITSFCSGFAVKSLITEKQNVQENSKKVTGIGGIFFKCKDPNKLRDWYKTNLGLNTNKYGTSFVWYQGADSTKKGYTQWGPFSETTKYFEPSKSDFMINYRVQNMDALVIQLKQAGITFTDTVQTVSYGKFLHILDLEGNKVELWEPYDTDYDKFEGGKTK